MICANLKNVRAKMDERPDVLGAHLEGPFLRSPARALMIECLKDRSRARPTSCWALPTAASARSPSRRAASRHQRHQAVHEGGVVPAVGHCDADYETAKAGFDAGAGIMTHMFNAMNGLHHRKPGPIPAAVEDPRVTIELINDGFHVQDPMVKLGFEFAPHRTAFVTTRWRPPTALTARTSWVRWT